MTFSLAARCPDTGMFGVVITSSSINVGSRCPWARAGVGAISTQNVTDPRLGALGLDLLERGFGAEQTLRLLTEHRPHTEHRQLTVVDADGHTSSFSGAKTLGRHGVASGRGCVAAGNLLAADAVPQAMVDAFESATGGHLAERLLRALEAGLEAGGEEDTVHSTALRVVDRWVWPLVDLRVDWHDEAPVAELRALWQRYQPQAGPYLTRALDPTAAPSYGVKGDR